MTAGQNWAGNITFAARRRHAPRSVEQLQELVAGADRIRALGTGHSFNRIADSPGDLVSVRELPGGLSIDADAGTVVVPAGARYGEVATALQERGLALANLGSLPHISVAGACATGTHGSGDGNRCLSAGVTAVEFVRADGELVRIDRSAPEFGGSVLSLGALGIVTRLTLAVEPAYDVRQDVWIDAALDAVLDDLDAVLAAGYSVSLFSTLTRPGSLDQIWIKSRVGNEPVDGSRWGARPATDAMHPIAGQDARGATEQGGRPGPWHERLPHFRLSFTPSSGDEQQSEFLVPRSAGAAAIAAVHRLDLGAVLQVAEFRSVAADDLWLSPFHDRDTVALHFTWRDDDALVGDAVARVEQALAPFDPRPHWGKVFSLPTGKVRAHYSRRAELAALAAHHDPDRKFSNPFLERYLY